MLNGNTCKNYITHNALKTTHKRDTCIHTFTFQYFQITSLAVLNGGGRS